MLGFPFSNFFKVGKYLPQLHGLNVCDFGRNVRTFLLSYCSVSGGRTPSGHCGPGLVGGLDAMEERKIFASANNQLITAGLSSS